MSAMGHRNRLLYGHAHWCHLRNTVERLCAVVMNGSATRDGDAASFHIIFSNLVVYLLLGCVAQHLRSNAIPLSWNSMGPTSTPTRTLGMRL